MKYTYTNQIPEKDFSKVSRLLSRDNITYFGYTGANAIDSELIDLIDSPIRLLAHLLKSSKECSILSCFCGYYFTKDEYKNLWNNIKREEKLIRNDGLLLKKYNKETVTFQDPTYRVYWPSFDGMVADLQDKGKIGWLVLSVLKNKQIDILNNQDLFGVYTKVIMEENKDSVLFTFKVECNEKHLAEAEWRRITEVLANIFVVNQNLVEKE